MCYSWLSTLISKSDKQGTLHIHDLYQLPDFLDSATVTNRLEANWFDEIKRSPANPSLIRATLRTIGWKPFLLGFLLFIDVNTPFQSNACLILLLHRDYFVLLNHYY